MDFRQFGMHLGPAGPQQWSSEECAKVDASCPPTGVLQPCTWAAARERTRCRYPGRR